MAKRKVSDIATQRKTSVDDVLAHLKKAGIEVVDGEVSVDDAAIEKAYAAAAGGAVRRRSGGGPGGQEAPRHHRRRRIAAWRRPWRPAARAAAAVAVGSARNSRPRRSSRPAWSRSRPGPRVKDISQLLGVTTSDIIKALMGYGEMVTITQTLSDEAIEVLATDFAREVEITHAADEEAELEKEAVDDPKDLEAAAVRHHRHGPRRPRQDQPARRHPRDRGGGRRGRRHHAAHRRLPGQAQRPAHHLHRHARPRGVHGHAGARRQGHRHRRHRRGGGRRRHAADRRGHRPRQGRPGARSSS